MTCSHVRDLLLAALDGPLPASDRAVVDEHLVRCADCVRRMKEFVVTSQVLRGYDAATEKDEAAPLPETLVRRILTATKALESGTAERKHKTG